MRERVQHWRQELNFPTQKDRIKSFKLISFCRELGEPAAF